MDEQTKRGGGPKTPEGKARASQNSTKHGVLSEALILPDECREDYDKAARGWKERFRPDGYEEERLVELLVRNDWFLKRADRRWQEAERTLVALHGSDPLKWTAEDRHSLELLQRYRTTAERSFYRAWNAMRTLRKDRMKLEDERNEYRFKWERAELRLQEHESHTRQEAKKAIKPEAKATEARGNKKPKLRVVEQWVEVRSDEQGQTQLKLCPENEDVRKKGEKIGADLVYRRFHFVGGVPEEYAWTTSDPAARKWGGMGTQRMTFEKWKERVAVEALTADGQLRPCGGNLPRPKERGGCECKVCVGNQGLLEAAGLE
ncbi:MAG TPA: hypothetical protein VHZ55_09330 [Bryobacteraceae bacterium]|jgi:hypothetical protein|nr:hypothetical protein [Bryobacteraceae bacterium]